MGIAEHFAGRAEVPYAAAVLISILNAPLSTTLMRPVETQRDPRWGGRGCAAAAGAEPHAACAGEGGVAAAALPSRRAFGRAAYGAAFGLAGAGIGGCRRSGDGFGRLEEVWGRRGIIGGRFQRPRAMAIDNRDRLFIVDFMARVHVFTAAGEFLFAWQMPTWENGKPTGITVQHGASWGRDAGSDRVLMADTHYFRVMAFTLDGRLQEDETIGGVNGPGPGEFGFVTDAQRDSTGCLYVSEYGGYDRIQKFSPDGEFLSQWGQNGGRPGEFNRPQNFVIDAEDRVWVCDACNHRVQVFDARGELLSIWGEPGRGPGRLSYPYDIALAGDGTLFLCEFGNHRVQRFTTEGEPLGCWGREGRGPGELHSPWSCVLDSRRRLHVLDTWNHRVQRVKV